MLWALFRDRARGRLRCPKCWYDLSGASAGAGGYRCPECGRVTKREKKLKRTHRKWWGVALALVLVIGGYGVWTTPRVVARGWVGAVPTTVLIGALPWLDAQPLLEPPSTEGLRTEWLFEETTDRCKGSLWIVQDLLLATVIERLRSNKSDDWYTRDRRKATKEYELFNVLLQRYIDGRASRYSGATTRRLIARGLVSTRARWSRDSGVWIQVGRDPLRLFRDCDLEIAHDEMGVVAGYDARQPVLGNASKESKGRPFAGPWLVRVPSEWVRDDRLQLDVRVREFSTENPRSLLRGRRTGEIGAWTETVVLPVDLCQATDDILEPSESEVIERALSGVRFTLVCLENESWWIRSHNWQSLDGPVSEFGGVVGLRIVILCDETEVGSAVALISDPGHTFWGGHLHNGEMSLPVDLDVERYEALRSESGRLRYRIDGDPNVALLDFGATKAWVGSVTVPLSVVETE